MGTPTWSETDYPFGSPVSPATGPLLTSDLNIDKNNPAVEFTGTENNAVYTEIREQGGDWYFATNATYTTGWVPSNNANPAYVTIMKGTGQLIRAWCAAGTSPIVWTTLWQVDPQGAIAATPATFTTGVAALSLTPTWNMGSTVATGIVLNVTDTASNAASKLLDLQVSAASKFNVAKNGVLTSVSGASFGGALTITSGGAAITGQVTVNNDLILLGGAFKATALAAYSSAANAGVGDGVFQRTTSGGAIWIGGATAAGEFDFGLTTASVMSLTGGRLDIISNGLRVAPTINSTNTLSYVPPVYTTGGVAAASTVHIVQGSVTAGGASTTITLSGAAVFTGTSYSVFCADSNAGNAPVAVTQVSGSSFSFPTTSGHNYNFIAIGV